MTEEKKLIIRAKFIGLGRSGSITCEALNKQQDIFWPKHNLSEDKFKELWNYCKGEWKDKKLAIIECDGLREDGSPISPVFINFEE